MKGIILNFSPNSTTGSSAYISKIIYRLLKNHIKINIQNVNDYNIKSCGSCSKYCYTNGECVEKDDMTFFYKHFKEDDFIIIVTPTYFYHIPGYAKILIDRCQPYWVQKYILKKSDLSESKNGFLISIGATKGKKLFSGINLTIRYFFDIFNFNFNERLNLYLRNIEIKKDLSKPQNKKTVYKYCSLLKRSIID
ncbi:MAG: flavodoxin family protein [Endomicrobia bacterium]|nr:flavodoxin family protein [Endomicrobiia bacterium]